MFSLLCKTQNSVSFSLPFREWSPAALIRWPFPRWRKLLRAASGPTKTRGEILWCWVIKTNIIKHNIFLAKVWILRQSSGSHCQARSALRLFTLTAWGQEFFLYGVTWLNLVSTRCSLLRHKNSSVPTLLSASFSLIYTICPLPPPKVCHQDPAEPRLLPGGDRRPGGVGGGGRWGNDRHQVVAQDRRRQEAERQGIQTICSYSVKPRSSFLIVCFTFAVQENTKTTKPLSFPLT